MKGDDAALWCASRSWLECGRGFWNAALTLCTDSHLQGQPGCSPAALLCSGWQQCSRSQQLGGKGSCWLSEALVVHASVMRSTAGTGAAAGPSSSTDVMRACMMSKPCAACCRLCGSGEGVIEEQECWQEGRAPRCGRTVAVFTCAYTELWPIRDPAPDMSGAQCINNNTLQAKI